MTDRLTDHNWLPTDRDRPPTGQAGVSMAEAARILGVTPEAVRSRIRRGTLSANRTRSGWVVYLTDDPVGDRSPTDQRPTERPVATDHDRPADQALIAAKDETIAVLRGQVETMQATITAQATSIDQLQHLLNRAMLALPAQVVDVEPAQRVPEAPGAHEAPEQGADTSQATPRPWWKKVLGLP